MSANTRSSPATASPVGTANSISIRCSISTAVYLKNGAPTGANPRPPNHPKTSPNSFPAVGPISSLLTTDLIATYGCSERSTIFGEVVICLPFHCYTSTCSTNDHLPQGQLPNKKRRHRRD